MFFPRFGKVLTFASFQDDGKCESHKQWLNWFINKLLALVKDA
jgi:hypothetical protein